MILSRPPSRLIWPLLTATLAIGQQELIRALVISRSTGAKEVNDADSLPSGWVQIKTSKGGGGNPYLISSANRNVRDESGESSSVIS